MFSPIAITEFTPWLCQKQTTIGAITFTGNIVHLGQNARLFRAIASKKEQCTTSTTSGFQVTDTSNLKMAQSW